MSLSSSTPSVGVVASAGDLDAFQEILVSLGPRPGVAVVFVLHLDSAVCLSLAQLCELTPLEVVQLTGSMQLQANTVYVCPPRQILELDNGFARVRDAQAS